MQSNFSLITKVIFALTTAIFCLLIGSFMVNNSAAESSNTTQSASPQETDAAVSSNADSGTQIGPSNSTVAPSVSASPTDGEKVAYMTFDDGPSKLTPELLDILKSCNVHATFFVVGLNAEKYTDALKQIASGGNVIGIHSWTHNYAYIYKNTTNFLADFNKLKDYIITTTGTTPNICRFPGGTNNTVCFQYNKSHIMKSIVSLVKGMGFQYFDWNVSSGEANATPPSKDEIINAVVSQCKGKKIAVILFHDTDNQGYIDAIPEIVSQLSSMGFTFDTLSPSNPPDTKASAVQFKAS